MKPAPHLPAPSPWPSPGLITHWPAPALAAWLLAWAGSASVTAAGAGPGAGWVAGLAIGLVMAVVADRGRWRRLLVAAGFPLSSLVLGAAVPDWGWAAAGLALLAVYPASAWRDAPFFPTPARALQGLPGVLQMPPAARALDAGCGLGDGLRALRRAFPALAVDGVERSRPLAWACGLRCRFATVRRGDMWAGHWGDYGLVYIFQRPETMARAWAKATREMARGAWFVSLEFAVPGVVPHARLDGAAGRPVWVYRVGGPLRRPLGGPFGAVERSDPVADRRSGVPTALSTAGPAGR